MSLILSETPITGFLATKLLLRRFLAHFANTLFQNVLAYDIIRSITCEHVTTTLSCRIGTVMHIHYANYGRLVPGQELCPHSNTANQNCKSPNSMAVLIDKCEGKQSCSVYAHNTVFIDVCGTTYKYLEVHFSCE